MIFFLADSSISLIVIFHRSFFEDCTDGTGARRPKKPEGKNSAVQTNPVRPRRKLDLKMESHDLGELETHFLDVDC